MKTLQLCIDEGEALFNDAQLFFGHGTDNAADEAFWLSFAYLKLPWDSDVKVLDQVLTADDYQQIHALYRRRIDERVPAAYLLGEAWFAGYAFIVNEHVLVPRSPLAELIQQAYSPWLSSDIAQPHILDLCTGSGCIGIASALLLPEAQLVLSDISTQAIAVAQQNIARYSLQQRVNTVESDLFSAFDASMLGKFDLIVANPPYVDAEDYANMPAEYHAEPQLGLTSGDDGLDFTRRLLREAADYLTAKGVLIVEVGNSERHLVSAFPAIPFVWLDFAHGGHGVFVITKDDLIEHQHQF